MQRDLKRKTIIIVCRPVSELVFPFSTNFGASGLAEDTYETSNTVIH